DVGPPPPRPSAKKATMGKGWFSLFFFVCLLISRCGAVALEVEATSDLSAGQRRLDAHDEFSHFWDFRGCSGTHVVDAVEGSSLNATYQSGASCGTDGLSLDGIDDYADIDDWEWGGTTSFEVYVKYDSFNYWSRIFDFSNRASSDNVLLSNYGTTSTMSLWVYQGSTNKHLSTSNWDSSTWTHVVATVSGTNMKVYKNGALAGTKTDGWEPSVQTRTQHWLGRSAWSSEGYFDGTIAYVKMWHGVELQQSDVTELYAPHNTAHHFWDFRNCSTGNTVTDSIAGDLVATPKNGPICGADGLRLDGNDDYADVDDWEWGGTTSIEVYVKYDSINSYSRVFGFGNGAESDNVVLCNKNIRTTIEWSVRQGSSKSNLYEGNFDLSTWTHVVATVSGTTMKVYKNGVLAGTKINGHEPNVLTRTNHIIGATNWAGMDNYMDGTIAYMKMWHGVELQQADVTDLFNGRDTTLCPSITSSGSNCTTCEAGKYAGKYSNSNQASTFCLACEAGKASSTLGLTKKMPGQPTA
ncbi:hypothetical protein TrVE_jg3029, partial [Triparma verrucosa]